MITITTTRLLIRNVGPDDAVALREVVLQKESGPYTVYDYEWPTSEEGIAGILERLSGYDGFLAICQRETGAVAGFLSFDRTSREEPPQFELGFCLHPGYQHRGYVTEACTALIDSAFRVLRAVQINSGTAAVNAPSLAVLARLGMRQVREETIAFRKMPDGTPLAFTGHIFVLTGKEWAAHRAGSPSASDSGRHRAGTAQRSSSNRR